MATTDSTPRGLLGPVRHDELRAALRPVVEEVQRRARELVDERARVLSASVRRQAAVLAEDVDRSIESSRRRMTAALRPDAEQRSAVGRARAGQPAEEQAPPEVVFRVRRTP